MAERINASFGKLILDNMERFMFSTLRGALSASTNNCQNIVPVITKTGYEIELSPPAMMLARFKMIKVKLVTRGGKTAQKYPNMV